jgi:hypothetical protein
MGVGNVGEKLLPLDQGYTYLSRDAGQSWVEISRKPNFYEFGNYGSLIVMVEQNEPTRQLKYSWNTGKNWATYTFAERPIRVTELSTRPGSTSTRFIIIGVDVSEDGNNAAADAQQVVVQVDFSQLEPRKCK